MLLLLIFTCHFTKSWWQNMYLCVNRKEIVWNCEQAIKCTILFSSRIIKIQPQLSLASFSKSKQEMKWELKQRFCVWGTDKYLYIFELLQAYVIFSIMFKNAVKSIKLLFIALFITVIVIEKNCWCTWNAISMSLLFLFNHWQVWKWNAAVHACYWWRCGDGLSLSLM